jgi:Zn-dependent M32 family carboxypeptidase
MACQFFEAAKRDIPQLEDKLARGEFAPLKQWLNKVH